MPCAVTCLRCEAYQVIAAKEVDVRVAYAWNRLRSLRKERLDSGGLGHTVHQEPEARLAAPSLALPRLLKEQSFEHQLRCERQSKESSTAACASACLRLLGGMNLPATTPSSPEDARPVCAGVQGSTERSAEGSVESRPARQAEDTLGSDRAVQEE
jgi:hypothetical protein